MQSGDKPPHLALVAGDGDPLPAPPRKLGEHGTRLWRSIQTEFLIVDSGGLELLAQAAAALDRAESLAEAIARDGPIIYVRGTPRSHPGLKDELQARALCVRTLERLGVTSANVQKVGRPAADSWSG